MRYWSQSLSTRLFALTSIFAIIAVAIIALVLTQLYRTNAERRFGELLTANLYNLMGSVEVADSGRLQGQPDLRDPRFLRFRSGWYWSVVAVADNDNQIGSPSLAGETIPVPEDVALDASFQRIFQYDDSASQRISAVEAQVFLGAGDEIYSFRVTGNRGELEDEITTFVRSLVSLLALFAVGFVVAGYGIVRLGLNPISGATRRLADIRDGRAERLEGEFPEEIQPLIDEANALIESNTTVIERARTQVGNLAHSLKTPLAVLRNEADSASPQLRRLIVEQTDLMQGQVETYLNRARIAARHGTVTSRTVVKPVVDRLVRVIAKLNPDKEIDVQFPDGNAQTIAFAGERQDLEEILGNLLENAARFAKNRIVLSISRLETEPPKLMFSIEDDGPGMDAEQAAFALKRGNRLDESKPGSGLGLSIVKDISAEYGGSLALQRSDLGGLAARVELPAR